MFQGMAFGAGSEVAHTAVRGMMGGDSHQNQAPPQEAPQNHSSQGEYILILIFILLFLLILVLIFRRSMYS